MSKEVNQFICKLNKSIHTRFHLKGNESWKIKGAEETMFFSPKENSSGFSFDKEEKGSLWIFADFPPEYIAKMCDGIIAFACKDRAYIALIELKSTIKKNAEKQILNAMYTCRFLVGLLKAHGHTQIEPVFFGLIVYQKRRAPDKGTTTHTKKQPTLTIDNNSVEVFQEKNPHKSIVDLKTFCH